MASAVSSIVPVRKLRIRQIALPSEHGGWAFLLEPLVAGLAVAYSSAAPWVALMTIGAFLMRQPIKVLIADRMGMRIRERASAAFSFVLLYSGLFVAGLTMSLWTGGTRPMLPFAIVLPLIFIQIYHDAALRGRHLIPELAGAVSISASAAAIALAAGMPWSNAIALWLIFVARMIPSILYVRERLRLEKGKQFSKTVPILTHIAGLVLVSVLAYYSLSPFLVIFAILLLFIRSVEGLSPKRRELRAMQIGILEIVYGTLIVMAIVIGYYTGF